MTTAQHNHAQYVIGIDLGTSNIAVAYARLPTASDEQKPAAFEVWSIPQWLDNGQWGKANTLPALRYHPGAELDAKQHLLPWPQSPLQAKLPQAVFGHWAQQLGIAMPGRLVQSAKSWLCNPAEQTSLPWHAAEGVETISAVHAVASYLDYLRCAWLDCFPHAPLEQQRIQITVPASFDEYARALTQQAIELAGLPSTQLLEEPLAACYDWLHRSSDASPLNACQQLLVCDIGGGTSDFTLINITTDKDKHQPTLSRIAVGEHLMLGGDNIDLALAMQAQQKLTNTSSRQLDMKQVQQLTQQSRLAKEQLLASNAPEDVTINLLGSGSALIGGTQQTRLTRKEVEQLTLDGFFPVVEATAYPKQRSGALVQTGLPYPADAAISRHLASFLAPYAKKTGHYPDALLLNGSPFHSQQLRQRMIDQLQHWQAKQLTLLDNPEPGLAVARGAAYFGWLKQQNQQLIRSDAAHSYFAIVDSPSGKQAFCILPKGSATDQPYVLETPEFKLKCGQAVQFNVASDGSPQHYQLGQSIADNHQLHHLPALTTQLSGKQSINVRLTTKLSELGQLEIVCQSISNHPQQWPLSFNLRDHEQSRDEQTSEVKQHSLQNKAENNTVITANTLLTQVYGTQKPPLDTGKLRQSLEKQLGKREKWSASTARALSDTLLAGASKRRRSQKHERLWFNLTGFTLRPGAGMPDDAQRINQLWQLYKQNLQYHQESPNWIEWWILWRRVAAGLHEKQQSMLMNDIANVVVPGFTRNAGKKPRQQAGIDERTRLLGALERIPVDAKIEIGDRLIKKISKGENLSATAWALARVGARQLAYASPDQRVAPALVAPWIKTLLSLNWKKQPELCFPAAALTRLTDPAFLTDDTLRQQVIEKLEKENQSQRWTDWLSGEDDLSDKQNQIWGDSLPSGLSLSE
ncbi:MAG: Hsp70 family protein [Gammaproteobacteria bacterium]|nr:Hsp70 family protein [Gammaproteobacteria bacterium]